MVSGSHSTMHTEIANAKWRARGNRNRIDLPARKFCAAIHDLDKKQKGDGVSPLLIGSGWRGIGRLSVYSSSFPAWDQYGRCGISLSSSS